MSNDRMTERQREAWPEALAEAQQYVGTSTIPSDLRTYGWVTRWEEELRPGRGHMLDAWWTDGEYLVQVRMDVYGYPAVAVFETALVHNSGDEECPCEPCATEREADE